MKGHLIGCWDIMVTLWPSKEHLAKSREKGGERSLIPWQLLEAWFLATVQCRHSAKQCRVKSRANNCLLWKANQEVLVACSAPCKISMLNPTRGPDSPFLRFSLRHSLRDMIFKIFVVDFMFAKFEHYHHLIQQVSCPVCCLPFNQKLIQSVSTPVPILIVVS